MGLFFKDRLVVGVSITPSIGIEAAIVDCEKNILVNYVSKPFNFDGRLNGSFDLDIFKETLYDALVEIGAPQGSKIVLNMPSSVFAVKDWPASIDDSQIIGNIEDDIYENPAFKDSNDEPHFDYYKLPNSTIQFNKIVHTAVPKNIATEIAIQIKDLKYQLVAIDTTVNSTLNALIYTGRIDVSPNTSWVMLIVDNNCCRVIPMQGKYYVDCIEESISIGEVLEDSENYEAVLHVVEPVLKNTPSSLLYIVSKTDVISAEKLASKINYKSQIVHLEANKYARDNLLESAYDLNPETSEKASLDVIGAAIWNNFLPNAPAQLNLFNKSLGDIYITQVPPMFMGVLLSVENMLKYGLLLAVVILGLTLTSSYFVNRQVKEKEIKINNYQTDIARIDKFLKEHEDISSQQFSEYDEVRIGLSGNKGVYSYYTIVGTEIPKKLWLTSLKLGDSILIQGQADNLESIYGFFRNLKDYDPNSPIKLQKLGLAGKNSKAAFSEVKGDDFDTESILTTLNADFYEFVISDKALPDKNAKKKDSETGIDMSLPDGLEPLE